MSISQHIDHLVAGIKPMLNAQGRDISVLEATEERIKLSLSGFCGGCDCSKDYVDGLKEMLSEQLPDVKDIELVVA